MEMEFVFFTTLFIFVSAQSIKQSVAEGKDLFVFCDGERSPEGSVYWENPNLQFHQEGPILSINEISRESSQYYECFDIDHSTNNTRNIFAAYVDVTYPAKILDNNYPKELVENETFSAELNVEGNPKPEVRLVQKSNGEVVYQSNNQGRFNVTFEVKCSSMDLYLLSCSNYLNNDYLYINLSVLCFPKPDPTQIITYKHAPRVGEFLKLEMIAIGYPVPAFAWTHGGSKVNHVDDKYKSTVDIQGVKVEDFGNTLTMSNSVGKDTVIYTIEADGPPDSASDLQVGDITLNSAKLSWQPGFDYGYIQTFTVLMFGQEVDQVTQQDHSLKRVTYTVNNLQQGETYSVQIKSSNSKGNAASLSNKVTFTTKAPSPPQPTPTPSRASNIPTTSQRLCVFLLIMFIYIDFFWIE